MYNPTDSPNCTTISTKKSYEHTHCLSFFAPGRFCTFMQHQTYWVTSKATVLDLPQYLKLKYDYDNNILSDFKIQEDTILLKDLSLIRVEECFPTPNENFSHAGSDTPRN